MRIALRRPAHPLLPLLVGMVAIPGLMLASLGSADAAPTGDESVLHQVQTATKAKKGKKALKGRYAEYVALGDSWSADVVLLETEGLPDSTYAPIDCAQSNKNYPKLVAAKLEVARFKDATCGSATTDHFTKPQTGLPIGGTNPPQFDRLTKRTDLVTVGIGGNDAAVASGAMSCISALPVGVSLPTLPIPDVLPLISLANLPVGNCKERFNAGGYDELARNIKQSQPKVVRALRQIHQRSPKARILLVNYLDAIPAKGCWPMVPITDSDMAYLNQTFAKLNAMLARAAKKGGAELVDTHPLSTGHDVCTAPTTRYVEGLGVLSINDLSVAIPAHPNAAGARAQAQSVMRQLRR